MKKQIRRAKEKPGRLRVGFANGVLQLFPIETLFGFIRENPDMQVEWCEYENDTLIKKLCDAELEYGLVVGRQPDAGLIQSLMCTCPVVLLVYEGHPLYGEEAISLPMLKNEKLIVMNEQFRIYHDFIAACQVDGRRDAASDVYAEARAGRHARFPETVVRRGPDNSVSWKLFLGHLRNLPAEGAGG